VSKKNGGEGKNQSGTDLAEKKKGKKGGPKDQAQTLRSHQNGGDYKKGTKEKNGGGEGKRRDVPLVFRQTAAKGRKKKKRDDYLFANWGGER